jgi:hypothetical protein
MEKVPRQNVRRHNILGQNIRRDKTSGGTKHPEGQNVQRHNIRGTKHPLGQKVPRDKTSVWVIFLRSILGNTSVSDGKGLYQPACQEEWKKCKKEEE